MSKYLSPCKSQIFSMMIISILHFHSKYQILPPNNILLLWLFGWHSHHWLSLPTCTSRSVLRWSIKLQQRFRSVLYMRINVGALGKARLKTHLWPTESQFLHCVAQVLSTYYDSNTKAGPRTTGLEYKPMSKIKTVKLVRVCSFNTGRRGQREALLFNGVCNRKQVADPLRLTHGDLKWPPSSSEMLVSSWRNTARG